MTTAYLVGSALLTVAGFNEGGLTAGLAWAGALALAYSFFAMMATSA